MRIKSTGHDVVEEKHGARDVAGKGLICQDEVRVVIEDVQLLCHGLVRQMLPCERHELVKHRQGVTEGAVGFLRDDVQRLLFRIHTFLGGDVLQMRHRVGHGDAVEVEDLATGQNRRQDFVLFRGGQNEHRVRRRFLQCFQKRIERRLTEHVHLVNDVHLVFALLRRNPDLIHDASDVLHLVV